jgi:hypothetical protein
MVRHDGFLTVKPAKDTKKATGVVPGTTLSKQFLYGSRGNKAHLFPGGNAIIQGLLTPAPAFLPGRQGAVFPPSRGDAGKGSAPLTFGRARDSLPAKIFFSRLVFGKRLVNLVGWKYFNAY